MDRLSRPPDFEQALSHSPSLVGTVIGRRYRLERMIGRGGAGALFKAYDSDLARHVALKLLLARDTETEINIDRFLQEARIASSLRHPNIVEVFDVGISAQGAPFLVMELLEGESLGAAIKAAGNIDLECALSWLLPVMGAISFAHIRGVLHRDLKPENIFLAKNAAGRVVPKLLDFGIAKRLDQATLTNSGTVVGTPSYMSPEQALAEPLGPATDIWSMGVIWFRCLSGRLPFEADTLTSVLLKIVNNTAPMLETLAPHVSPGVGASVDRALRRDALRRYESMPQMAAALLESALEAGVAVPDDPDPIGLPEYRSLRVASASTLDAPRAATKPRVLPVVESRPRRRVSNSVLFVVFAIFALLGFALWRMDADHAVPQQTMPKMTTKAPRTFDHPPAQPVPLGSPTSATAQKAPIVPADQSRASSLEPSLDTPVKSVLPAQPKRRAQRSLKKEAAPEAAPKATDLTVGDDVNALETHWQ